MKPDNFIAFFTICGFFIGLCFCILRIEDAFEILVYTLVINFAFYIIIHIAIMNFIDAKTSGRKKVFNKFDHEEKSNEFIKQLEIREKRMERILDSVSVEIEKVRKINNKKIKRQLNEQAS